MFDLALTLGVLWFGTVYGFPSCVHAKQMWEQGRLTTFWAIHYVPGIVVFVVLDCAFNVVFGSIIFRERPREWLFTHRVQRHVDESGGYQLHVAVRWGRRLNAVDANHIQRLPPR